MRDPKQVLNTAIDEAFAHDAVAAEKPIKEPRRERRVRLDWIPIALVASSTLGVAATVFTVLTVLAARRRMPAMRKRLLVGKPTRHVGYGRYRLGRIGSAYLAYTYKIPEVRVRLPRPTYKLPLKSR
jgi:hypothetical protein